MGSEFWGADGGGPPRLDWSSPEGSSFADSGLTPEEAPTTAGRSRPRRAWLGAAGLIAAAVVAVPLLSGPSDPGKQPVADDQAGESLSQPSSTEADPPREEPTAGTAMAPAVTAPATEPSTPAAESPEVAERSRVLLEALPIGNGSAVAPYDRDAFGQQWADTDRNGCDTRNDILRRDLIDVVVKPGTHGCVAYSGAFVDPYSGRTMHFERGAGNAGELHIDHIVSLSNAWHRGAAAWSAEQRLEFANDPSNLVVTFGDINMGKGAGDAGSWLPVDSGMHCGFAVNVIEVKDTYGLAVSTEERAGLNEALGTCSEASVLLIDGAGESVAP